MSIGDDMNFINRRVGEANRRVEKAIRKVEEETRSLFVLPEEMLLEVLKDSKEAIEAMKERHFAIEEQLERVKSSIELKNAYLLKDKQKKETTFE